ncbi:MAG TPA: hypothetical protein PLW10_04220 [Myxococcota bacterium]|nr:hypothetical protein [Myxococcota bacterium]
MSRTFVRSALGARVGLAALSLLGVALGSTRPAMALSQADFEGTALETICQDACVGLPALDGSDLTFSWAARARVDDLDIRLHTTGRVHLLGPIRATGSVTLLSDTSIAVMDGVAIDVGETLTISTLGDLDLLSGEITIGRDRIDLGEVRTPPDGDITIGAGGVVIASALSAADPAGPTWPALAIARDGDLYLDLSGVQLARLEIKAAGGIVIGASESVPVPEPTPALLAALGLAVLAGLRPRARGVARVRAHGR